MSSEGWILLALRNEPIKSIMEDLVQGAIAVGLAIEHPVNGSIMVFDESGDYWYQWAEFLDALNQRDDTSFNWWWGESFNVRCRMRRVRDCVRIDYATLFAEQLHTYRLLSFVEAAYSRRKAIGTALGFGLDSIGFTYTYPWLDILTSGDVVIDGYPDKLILSKDAGRRLLQRNPTGAAVCQDLGDRLIICRKGMIEWEEEMGRRPQLSPSELAEGERNLGPRTLVEWRPGAL